MTRERFIQADCLPVEVIDRIQRKLRNLYRDVQDDPKQTGIMTVRFVVSANEIGDLDGDYSLDSKLADRCKSEIGKIRDGQLVLPGTGLRVEENPADWRDGLLASPTGSR